MIPDGVNIYLNDEDDLDGPDKNELGFVMSYDENQDYLVYKGGLTLSDEDSLFCAMKTKRDISGEIIGFDISSLPAGVMWS